MSSDYQTKKKHKDFTLVQDNFLSNNECDELVEKYKNLTSEFDNNKYGYSSYFTNNITFSDQLKTLIDTYTKTFKESALTPYPWVLKELRFKWFKPGNWFKDFHCEHGYDNNKRVLNFMIYLSDHNCGTEFYKGEVIKSIKGRVAMFPAYFTHLHRGQQCPDNHDRYIMGGYFNYEDNQR